MKLMLVFTIYKLSDMTASVNWDLPLRQKSTRVCLCSHSLKSGPDGIFEGSFCEVKQSQHSERKHSNLENEILQNEISIPRISKIKHSETISPNLSMKRAAA